MGLTINEAVPYVAEGSTLTFKADVSDIYSSDNKTTFDKLGLYWQVNDAQKDTLTTDAKTTNPEFVYTADTLGTYSITCFVYAGTSFYNGTATSTFKCIDPDTAMTGMPTSDEVLIGGLTWKTKNLYDTESGTDYKGAEVVSPLFGKLYTWEEASTACPSGWHLPTISEWETLGTSAFDLMGNVKFLDEKMWKPAIGQEISDVEGFCAIPIGYQDKAAHSTTYRKYGEYAIFWAQDETSDPDLAQFVYISYDSDKIMKGSGSKSSLALSVRCVK